MPECDRKSGLFCKMAGGPMAGGHFAERGNFGLATRLGHRAARVKRTAGGRINRRRHFACQNDPSPLRGGIDLRRG